MIGQRSSLPIRGRGGPSKQWRPPNSECIKKKRKAPGDDDDDGLSSNDGGSKIPKTAKQAKPLQDRLTSIEGLPTEVLENIIILSENPNLLRASLWIGMLFTHKLAMQELIIGAFGPTWDRWHSLNRDQIREIEARRIYSKQILPKDDDAGGNPEFQSGILACDWVTINDILSAQQVWYRRSGKQRFRNMNPMAWWLVRKRPDDDEADGETRKLPPDVFKEHPVVDAAGLFKQDWQNILDQFNDPCEEPDPDKLYYEAPPTDWGYWELHPRTRVPDHLLNGPWTPDRAQYLFWLVRGGAQILASHHWELTKQGYEAMLALTDEQLAQKQPNTPRATADQLTKILVFLFHRLGVFVKHWPLHLLEEKKQELDDGFWERYYLFSVAGPMLSEGIDVKLDAEKAERARSHTRAYLSADRTQPSPGQESYA